MTQNEKTNTPDVSGTPEKLPASERAVSEVFDWVQTFCQALFAVVFIFTFLFRFVTVDGHSMDKTLANGDRLIITDVAYHPQRGDIVVIHDTESQMIRNGEVEKTFRGPIIKRVIATEGETVIVDYENWKITVIDTDGNTHVLEEPYVNFPDSSLYADPSDAPQREPDKSIYPRAVGQLEEHVVAEGCVFVCGDNRANSLDSRYVGDIDARKILGKALWRVFPFTSFGSVGHVDYDN